MRSYFAVEMLWIDSRTSEKITQKNMSRKKSNKKVFWGVQFLILLVIIVILVVLVAPTVLKARKSTDKVRALGNMKHIHLIMMDFEQDYHSFPDSNTARMKPELHTFTGEFSNQFLGQLIAGGYTPSEEIFYAKGGNPSGDRKPDNVIHPANQILQAGECGISYVLVTGGSEKIKGLRGLSSDDYGGLPYLCSPMESGGNDATFRYNIHKNRGLYLRIDGSAKDERLDEKSNRLKLPGTNRTLFETGDGTVWGSGENALVPTVLMPQ